MIRNVSIDENIHWIRRIPKFSMIHHVLSKNYDLKKHTENFSVKI